MNDEILQMTELAMELADYLMKYYRSVMTERYQLEQGREYEPVQLLEHICETRKCYKKGQEPDYEKAASLLIEDFRSGRIGRITLELPDGEEG